MKKFNIPFNIPFVNEEVMLNIDRCLNSNKLSGDGQFTKDCHLFIQKYLSCYQALLTHSCTAALEMSALLIDIKPEDEVIMPSYTFVSTANAFVLFGATPVFVDIRPDTLNLHEELIADAITPKTKAIVPVHYAGVACNMDAICNIAQKNHLYVIEDAAQALDCYFDNKPLGTFGDLAAFSFHETKNIISGEGGALIVNNPIFKNRAEIIREKGTNRSQFLRGDIDKYTWYDVGSSYLPSELNAAFLLAQFQILNSITKARLSIWDYYYKIFAEHEKQGFLRRPIIPQNTQHNGHIFYIILSENISRENVLMSLKNKGINATSHYEPLHSSPAGTKYSRVNGDMLHTNVLSKQIIRLPMWIGLEKNQQDYIAEQLFEILYELHGCMV